MTRSDDDLNVILRRLTRLERKLDRVQTYLVATVVLSLAALLLSSSVWLWYVLAIGTVVIVARVVWVSVKPTLAEKPSETTSAPSE